MELELAGADLAALPDSVLSASVWGGANATSALQRASRAVAEYMNALGELEGMKRERERSQ